MSMNRPQSYFQQRVILNTLWIRDSFIFLLEEHKLTNWLMLSIAGIILQDLKLGSKMLKLLGGYASIFTLRHVWWGLKYKVLIFHIVPIQRNHLSPRLLFFLCFLRWTTPLWCSRKWNVQTNQYKLVRKCCLQRSVGWDKLSQIEKENSGIKICSVLHFM